MGAILLHSATRYNPVKPCSQVLNLTAASHLSVIYNFASAVVAAEFNRRLQLRVSSDRLQIWSTDRSSQYVPPSEGLHVSRLVTVSPHWYVELEALRVPRPVRKPFNCDRARTTSTPRQRWLSWGGFLQYT